MSVLVERLPGKPVILLTVNGRVSREEARAAYARIGELVADMEGTVYRITDIRQMETSFVELIAIIREAMKDLPGTTVDPRIKNMYIGDSSTARMARDLMSAQMKHASMPVFPTLEEAFASIDWQIELTARQGGSLNTTPDVTLP